MGCKIKRALISVSNKDGIVEFARGLEQLGVEIISTGGTYSLLRKAGIAAVPVSRVTDFPEILDGRVKTLHPKIHGGLLALGNSVDHQQQLQSQGIVPIGLVVVNLYPFAETIAQPNVPLEEAIENIDIGGPSMLRAAAKNYPFVSVVVDADDYALVLNQLRTNGQVSEEDRFKLAAKAFRHTAAYDSVISQYLTAQIGEEFPESMTVTFSKQQDLRYGENSHQKAAFYRRPVVKSGSLVGAKQLQGKELSYNNINDADTALAIIREFSQPAAVAVKHMNPCGIGCGQSVDEAFQRAYAADPVSIFGGIVAVNRGIDGYLAKAMTKLYLEVVLAPSFSQEALQLFSAKENLRLLQVETIGVDENGEARYQSVFGGLLLQDQDRKQVQADDLQTVTRVQPTEAQIEQLLFAWKAVKHVKSNAIVLAKDQQTIGIGAGQMNRVGAARIAIEQAGEKSRGAVLASDAFFPMPDTVELAAQAGVQAIIQPGGSIKDAESIATADRFGIAMVFTGIRHFRH